MLAFDASSMIHAWDSYPVKQFPGLWEWMAVQVGEKNLVMPSVALKEVADKTPDCRKWLKSNGIKELEITNVIIQDALRIKGLLGIAGGGYHPNGVGENDLFIIATARAHRVELVSNEARQNNPPQKPAKSKIPLVCAMQEVDVSCIDFIDYIKRSGEVFG